MCHTVLEWMLSVFKRVISLVPNEHTDYSWNFACRHQSAHYFHTWNFPSAPFYLTALIFMALPFLSCKSLCDCRGQQSIRLPCLVFMPSVAFLDVCNPDIAVLLFQQNSVKAVTLQGKTVFLAFFFKKKFMTPCVPYGPQKHLWKIQIVTH